MNKTFYTSDHHFFHENIINLCNRPFKDLSEMNQFMIDSWNSVVAPIDNVIYGGDLVLGSSRHYKEKVKDLLLQLNGVKFLVRGNHDRSRKVMLKLGFIDVYPFTYLTDSSVNIFIVHNLMRNFDQYQSYIEVADVVLYGHAHNKVYDDSRIKDNKKFINISVENLDYLPYTILQLIGKSNAKI
jgi:calcineurin-like phosphoesterase family protein